MSPSSTSPKTTPEALPKKCGNPSCPSKSSDDSQSNLKTCARCMTVAYCSPKCQASAWPTHKSQCRPQNYILKFQLHPGDIVNPPVERTLSCPAHYSFYVLHLALQTAFGWATTHSFDFAVLDPDYKPRASETGNPLLDLIEMTERMSMPGNEGRDPLAPREYLLRVVDAAPDSPFSGIDRMHEGKRRHPETVEKDSSQYLLYKFFEDKKYQGKQMVYTYDFGDNWEHYMTIVGRAPPTDDFICLDGKGHGVAEDVGAWMGWEELKEAYRAKKPTKEQKDRRRWFENQASNSDPKGLSGDCVEWFDKDAINKALPVMWDRFNAMADEAEQQRKMLDKVLKGRGMGNPTAMDTSRKNKK
ncbi:plasmid p 4b orf-3 family protein [Naviculisporaceae sp. PSN 640]